VPYRLDLRETAADAAERLIDLGALDVELVPGGRVTALMPDRVRPDEVAMALGTDALTVSPAVGRDADSVWVLRPRPIPIGAHTLELADGAAFGTGLHPTTSLCLDALTEAIEARATGLLDVGIGSGVLALAALLLGVPAAVGIDIDDKALREADANARLNRLQHRLRLARGGPEAISGSWPLVVANVLAAPLIEMAPVLARRVGHRGHLILSGIPTSVEPDVARAYRRLGMQHVSSTSRAGWVAIGLRASW
jgi:ribosomal protein L11 methyltransferase